MIALDTNVLLNLYRSNERTRADTLAVLTKLRDRIWIPHQVLVEFWRNREQSAIRHHHSSKAKEARSALDKICRTAQDALDRWVTAVHLKNDKDVTDSIQGFMASLSSVVGNVGALIDAQAKKDALEGTADTGTDPVLSALEPLLQGRCGAPLSSEQHAKAVQEAQERAEEEVPPGYEDFRTKPPEQAAGDYILWVQLLEEAKSRTCDVLLVTGDVKKDWWSQRDGDIPARPRKELVLEMRNRAGVGLFMLTPSELLGMADALLGLQVDQSSVSDLEQLKDSPQMSSEGWTVKSLELFMKRLSARYQPQAKVITAAAVNGGFVDRETVYELAGYPADRQLKGFTRPISTVARELEEEGELSGDEPILLRAVYGSATEPSWATGFRVPEEVIPTLREFSPVDAHFQSNSRPDKYEFAISLAEAMLSEKDKSQRTPEEIRSVAGVVQGMVAATGREVSIDRIVRELESRMDVWFPSDTPKGGSVSDGH
ncbi:PIN-like domain-containing protein [Streptomyces sp. NPDC058430]|uniref:PIN-like domain-containing protein n=1 Tax=Streptomyces sp. NPDC058430 TaxID=3346495 RepID=UPI00366935B8